GGRGDDDLLRPALQVGAGLVGVGEEPGGLDDDVGADVTPGKLRRVARGVRRAALATDGHLRAGDLHLLGPPAEHAVVLEQVTDGGRVPEIVVRDQLDVRTGRQHRAEEVAADTAQPVDTNPDGHRSVSSYLDRRPARPASGFPWSISTARPGYALC